MNRYLLFLFLGLQSMTYGQRVLFKEFLGKPTQESVSVKVFFSADVEISAQYGISSGKYTAQTNWQLVKASEPGEILIDNLSPNSTYFYRLQYRVPASSSTTYRPEFTFQTQKSTNNGFSFVVQSDPHLDEQSDTALFRLCLQNQLDDQPDFMIIAENYERKKTLNRTLKPEDLIDVYIGDNKYQANFIKVLYF